MKNAEFVIAARAVGAADLRIILRHWLPNTIAPVILLLTWETGALVVLEAAFAFIGVSGTVQRAAIPEWIKLVDESERSRLSSTIRAGIS